METCDFWKRLFTAQGRLTRKPYILWILLVNIVCTAVIWGSAILLGGSLDHAAASVIRMMSHYFLGMYPGMEFLWIGILFGLIFVVISIPCLVLVIQLTIRRFHDLNRSGWFTVGVYCPIVNIFLIIYLLFFKGTAGKNRFGDDPLSSEDD